MAQIANSHQVASLLPHSILRYVELSVGRAEADAIREAVGEQRSIEELDELGSWTSPEVTIAIAEAAARLTGEANIGRRGGEEVFRQHRALGVVDLFTSEGSVVAALEQVVAMSSHVTTGRAMTVIEHGERHVLVEGNYQPGVPTPELFCNFALGYWALVPSLFGAEGYSAELACQARGDTRCLTRVTWTEPTADESETAAAAERRDLMSARYDHLQQMATDLAAADKVSTVLDLVVERAGKAVMAPRFLLAVQLDEHEAPTIHHRGFNDDAAAAQAAERVLTGRIGPSDLVVDVVTARATFGKIAAFFPEATEVLPSEERVMRAYAGHAAAALEAASALERARHDRDTAEALLELARSLASVGTPSDVSARLAAALPVVAGSQVTSVWLWDAKRSTLGLTAATGALGHLFPHEVSADDIGGLAQLVADPHPILVDVDNASGVLRQTMTKTDARHLAVVPVVAREAFLGVITAGFSNPVADDDVPSLLERLTAVADHAATALDNAQLVEHIRHQAMHDALTGLPNRPLIEDRAKQALRVARRAGDKVALLFLDLDRFKNVNDTLGHRAGDELIRQVVDRLASIMRPQDTLGRLGGDEFVVLATGVPNEAVAASIGRRLIEAFEDPFVVRGHRLFISSSIGVAIAPDHGADYDILLQHADAAMYDAKSLGRNTLAIHATDPGDARQSRLQLETELHSAVGNGELAVVYQPQIDLTTMDIVGVEALVRWHHPVRGTIPPDAFLPIAEESGLIVGIDRWVRHESFRQLTRWRDAGLPPVRMALNLSTREIRSPALARDLAADIADWGLDPDLIEVEITDRVVMAEADLPAILDSLRATGVRLAIDDFGTGSSVLARLQRCPVNTLKIDKSFVQEMADDSAGALVPALVQLAKTLDLDVIAEGVETAAQASLLRRLGCHMAQGFYFSRPAPADTITDLLRAQLGGKAEAPLPTAAV